MRIFPTFIVASCRIALHITVTFMLPPAPLLVQCAFRGKFLEFVGAWKGVKRGGMETEASILFMLNSGLVFG